MQEECTNCKHHTCESNKEPCIDCINEEEKPNWEKKIYITEKEATDEPL